jgi:hypothetical protein
MDRLTPPALTRTNPLNIIQEASPEATVDDIIPRLNEGGAYAQLSLPPSTRPEDIEAALTEYLKTTRIKPWWNPFQRMHVRLVLGKPWVEDLFRMPSARIKVEFVPGEPGAAAAELGQEQLYEFFRSYGKIKEISPQPFDSKIMPRYALLDYTTVRRAATAKNCLHGVLVPEANGGGKAGTRLKISYEPKLKHSWIKDWLFGHPRITIPIVAALLAGLTVAVFDPIRTFFIKLHIKHTFSLFDNRYWRWFMAQATDVFSFVRNKHPDAGMDVIWEDRRAHINQIQTWLVETADTFIIVQGPRGSGKKELVLNEAIKTTKHKLVIDCKPLQEARGEAAIIRAAAQQVGFRPVFSFMNTISGWIDLAAQGATGVKTGFSETLESQIQKILANTSTALKQIALESRSKSDSDADLSDDDWLETHPEKRPVVVVDNFLHKSQDGTLIYDKIAEWFASLQLPATPCSATPLTYMFLLGLLD